MRFCRLCFTIRWLFLRFLKLLCPAALIVLLTGLLGIILISTNSRRRQHSTDTYLAFHVIFASLPLVIATGFPLHSPVETPDSQTHRGSLQKYDENQWRNFGIWTLIFLISCYEPKNLIWLSELSMRFTLIIWR